MCVPLQKQNQTVPDPAVLLLDPAVLVQDPAVSLLHPDDIHVFVLKQSIEQIVISQLMN